MRKLLLLMMWCLVLGALTSCSDKEDTPEPKPAAELDYLPTTKGNTWTYGGISPYTLVATGQTKEINGKTYQELEMNDGASSSKSYVLKENGVYTAVGLVPNAADNVEVPILKEGAPVGESWEQTNVINGMTTKMVFTIAEKGGTKTVEDKMYNDVIHVKVTTTFLYMGVEFGVATTSNYYFAKGVGLILSDFESLGKAPLLTYEVK